MVGVISVHHVDKSNAIFHPRPRWVEKKIHTVLFSIHMDQECLIAIVHIILVDGQMLKMHCVMSFSLPFFKIYREICTLHSRLWLMYAAFWNLITGLQDFLCIRDINPSTVHNACLNVLQAHSNTHTHLTAFFPGLPRWAGTRKVKPIWILLKQETVSGSGSNSNKTTRLKRKTKKARLRPRQRPKNLVSKPRPRLNITGLTMQSGIGTGKVFFTNPSASLVKGLA